MKPRTPLWAIGSATKCALNADLDRGSAGDRYQVVLHVDATTMQSAGRADEGPSIAAEAGQAVVELNDGPANVSAETSRRMACDASLIVMRHSRDGAVLDVGRKTRTIPPAIRRALRCRRHHRAVHEGGFTIVKSGAGAPMFYRRRDCTGHASSRSGYGPRPHGQESDRLQPTPKACADHRPMDVAWMIDILRDGCCGSDAGRRGPIAIDGSSAGP